MSLQTWQDMKMKIGQSIINELIKEKDVISVSIVGS